MITAVLASMTAFFIWALNLAMIGTGIIKMINPLLLTIAFGLAHR